MRRRFGRGRRRGGAGDENEQGAPIDGAALMRAIGESGLAGAETLEPLELAGVATSFAALGRAGEVLVGASPLGGGPALFATLALARATPDFAGRAVAIAPSWSMEARRRLAVLAPQPFQLQAVVAPQLFDGAAEVKAAPPAPPIPVSPQRIGAGLARTEDRALFARALAGLEGLAAKHGGAVRGIGDRVELLLLTRAVASLRTGSAGVRLELSGPDRATLNLSGETLAGALDRLEGSLRKHLNDRRSRGSEEGLRASLLAAFEQAGDLRVAALWPLADGEAGAVDLVGMDGEGRVTVAASRERIDLRALGEVLDAALDPRVRWPLLLAAGSVPRGVDAPARILLAGQEFDDAALQVLSLLTLPVEAFDVVAGRGDPGLSRRELPSAPGAGVRAATPPPTREEAPAAEERPAAPEAAESGESSEGDEGDEGDGEGDEARRSGRSRGRRRGRSRGGSRGGGRSEGGRSEAAAEDRSEAAAEDRSEAAAEEETGGGIEELSLFDLDDDEGDESGPPRRRRRSRGGRRRGRRARGGGDEASDDEGSRERDGERRGEGRAPERSPEDDDELVDDDEDIVRLSDDVPELEEPVDLGYEDQEADEEGDREADEARKQRELKRRARGAKAEPEPPKPPRRRAAFVAHADRTSVLTAVLLARDVRLVESFWVYPQEDLMTFFRSVATDLRDETPIFLVGYTASPPARDTFQAASLYRGRLHWFDHHEWPPEDLVALGEAIGEDAVHIVPGSDSSLASVIAERTRRSRFSDKLVELATGRFTQHDFERWGRLWWHRAGDIAGRRGDRRADIEPLLAGRPSDLAKESARIEAPPPPPEVAFVSERDFRLVHFGGFVMVVLTVPEALDIHLAGRIARERYGAQLSLATREGSDLLVLGGDDSRSRRGLDLGSMAGHLASKHEWISALPDDDFVARVRVRDLHSVPGRLDEVVSEIAMGRSIVEG